MRHFKRPLIVTLIAFVIALCIGIVGATMIFNSEGTKRKKEARAQQLGSGVGLATIIVIAPFWFAAAGRIGKERREKRS
ncbi:MAG: hypothetical protein ACI8UO_001702 [Verrucomicrobiales bacterium]|jgi:hypothetical protein